MARPMPIIPVEMSDCDRSPADIGVCVFTAGGGAFTGARSDVSAVAGTGVNNAAASAAPHSAISRRGRY